MSEKIPIKTIGFEGLHRSGKGTQIDLLKKHIEDIGIPCVTIRGGGSRTNTGIEIGDKYSAWWQNHLVKLKSSGVIKEDWIEGSRRLAREVILFRNKFLPELAAELGSDRAVLLIDRSILSHMAMLDSSDLNQIDISAVYGERDVNNRKLPITADVFPDIIFYLKASPETLYSRLDANDPKYQFRKKNIDENTTSFDESIRILPIELKKKIIEIDANRSVDEVSAEISNIVDTTLLQNKI